MGYYDDNYDDFKDNHPELSYWEQKELEAVKHECDECKDRKYCTFQCMKEK